MSKAGSKIIKGLKEARAVARGEKLPARVTAVKKLNSPEAEALIAFLEHVLDIAKAKGRLPVVRITLEFPEKEKRAHGRKS